MGHLFRLELLIGKEKVQRLKQKKVFVLGLGGVGSYCAEALARSGVGHIYLVDYDYIEESNLNRQLQTHYQVIGRYKADVMKERILSYSPQTKVYSLTSPYPDKEIDEKLLKADYVADCIDMVQAKMTLIEFCHLHKIPLISCLGTANKIDPQKLAITDIYQTAYCPLARAIRQECKKRGILKLQVVASQERPRPPKEKISVKGKQINGTIMHVPAMAGLMMASHILNQWIEEDG